MSSPACQFYFRDWIVSTRAMTLEERGLYIDLLAWSWDQDGLADDTRELASLAGVPFITFKRLWPRVSVKFTAGTDGRLRNPRQEKERQALLELRAKRSRAGKASAAVRNGNKT